MIRNRPLVFYLINEYLQPSLKWRFIRREGTSLRGKEIHSIFIFFLRQMIHVLLNFPFTYCTLRLVLHFTASENYNISITSIRSSQNYC